MNPAVERLGVDEDDISHMRSVRRRENMGSVVRFFGYVLAAFGGMIAAFAVTSGPSEYPYYSIAGAGAAARSGLRPRWKTPLLLLASFLIGFGLMALGREANFGVVTYYGTYSRD